MNKLTGLISGAALTAGMGVASAEEVPKILGAADFQVMVKSEMASITGERRIRIRNVNTNSNTNNNSATACLAVCTVVIGGPPPPPPPTPT